MKILIVEDEPKTGEYLRQGLHEAGFVVDLAQTGVDGLHLAEQGEYELVILDVMLPGLNGWEVLKNMRQRGLEMPAMFLTARDQVEDRVKGLELGADDYLVKPFHFPELLSRINALRRRYEHSYSNDQVLVCGDLTVNLDTNRVERAGNELVLSAKEFKFLVFLVQNKNKIVTRSQILQVVWNTNLDTYTNVVDVYISYLRTKIDSNFSQKLIRTVKGRGYMITAN